jgi:adenosylcobinamide-GDP ribazoletransferase
VTAPAPRQLESETAERARPKTGGIPSPLRGMRAAFVLFTRIPVGGFPYRSEDWAWAAAHAPFVGLVVGGILGGISRLLSPLGALPSAVLVVGFSLLLTGALHEDGLADTSDALGGARDARRVLEILKDSRIGAFGGAALVISIAARAAFLTQLGPAALVALPMVGCAARVGPTWLIALLPYVTPERTAKSREVARAGPPQAVVATLWLGGVVCVAVSMGAITFPRAAALAVALLAVTMVTGWRFLRRAGGITGDFLGATEQIGEIAAFAVLAWKL